jgi:hypothetical protein
MSTCAYLSIANLVDVAGMLGRSGKGVPLARSEVGGIGVLMRSAAGVVPLPFGGTGVRADFSGRAVAVAGLGDIGSPLDYVRVKKKAILF